MCGLAGIINKKFVSFAYSTFCTLGIANDSRGGDSCGVFIDGRYEYGTNKKKLFKDFFTESPLINTTKKSRIALLHCRKASVGLINEKTAQPVIIKNGDNIEFVVMHNGTIHDYKELANKYIPKINIAGMTDSQVMAHIFYNAGYNVLEEYNGSGVFVIIDYRYKIPKVMFFKGASAKNQYYTTVSEERPLFCCYNSRELVFSSICSYLEALRPSRTVYTIKPNTLCEYNGDLVIIKEYDRSKQYQDKKYEVKPIIPNYFARNYSYSPYSIIRVDENNNLFFLNNKKMYGKYSINKWGEITYEDEEDIFDEKTYDVYFLSGIPLLSFDAFTYLNGLRIKSGLSEKDFISKYQNLIRYASLDQLYKKDNLWYKANTATESSLYTGTYRPFTTDLEFYIVDGKIVDKHYNMCYNYIEKLFNRKINLCK